MGLFSKKSSSAPTGVAPTAQAVQSALVENPKTLVLSFLHESSKHTGMREYIKNYAFQGTTEQRFLVLVEMKDNCGQTPSGVLLARWQLFQLEAMRWATSKGILLTGLACIFPLDKTTPLAELKARAQLQAQPAAQTSAALRSAAKPPAQPSPASVFANSSLSSAPESQIEVNHDDRDAAEEFFRLTQPPSQS